MTFLIPLKNKGFSGSSEDNFLWNEENIYVMDNHRLALWCWFQKMKSSQRYNLLHIDAHPDMSESALKHFSHDLWKMSLDEYRGTIQTDINTPLFRWDNYIEIFLQKYPELVGETFSSTHKVGQDKSLKEEIGAYQLPKFMTGIFGGSRFLNDLPWIVNLDLDYFISAAPEKVVIFSDEYFETLAQAIQSGLENNMIEILTVSLSPECCGSWEKAENILQKFKTVIQLKLA